MLNPFFAWRERRMQRRHELTELLDGQDELLEKVTDLSVQVEALVQLNRRREELVIAATTLAEALSSEDLARSTSSHFASSELAPLTDLLRTAGHDDAATWWEDANDPEGLNDGPFLHAV
ncbi:hypothetical protein ACFQ71_02895 [Streptomyces sp. NPDC056534]|uniref:hypothetical protein n=1 Tax=Streptomyces sp. NPDC056534 TaxID=3345857 RepID=UPI0036810B63